MYSKQAIQDILGKVAKKKLTPQKAQERLKHLACESFEFARVDHHRLLRTNLPEVVYAPGKSIEQIVKIARSLARAKAPLLITRLDEKSFRKIKARVPKLKYSKEARIAYVPPRYPVPRGQVGTVAVVTGGTSDIPVAEEAALTLEVMGVKVRRVFDVGVAGLHRLLDHIQEIESTDAIIAVAGMEGALPSVLAGLVSKPVVAVPTSVGYGASFKGLAPLLTMLNSCAQGVAVVNIDSGFNAACFALLLLPKAARMHAS